MRKTICDRCKNEISDFQLPEIFANLDLCFNCRDKFIQEAKMFLEGFLGMKIHEEGKFEWIRKIKIAIDKNLTFDK